MKLHDLLKLKCKIYYNGSEFIGSNYTIYSDTFKDLKFYPIYTFSEYPLEVKKLIAEYHLRVLDLYDLKMHIEKVLLAPLDTKKRNIEVVFARQVFFARARAMGYGYEMMANVISRDHSTAIYNVKQFLNLQNDKYVLGHYTRYLSEEEIAETVKKLTE